MQPWQQNHRLFVCQHGVTKRASIIATRPSHPRLWELQSSAVVPKLRATMASLAVAYQQQLRSNPLVTKSATSAALSVLGSFVASHIRGNPVKRKELAAFAIYGCVSECT